jgi:hypothetical protein
MSDFKVVGVVLGALPIIVSTLESSYESLGCARVAFRNKQFYLDRMINALSWQKTFIPESSDKWLFASFAKMRSRTVFGEQSIRPGKSPPPIKSAPRLPGHSDCGT